MSGRARAIIAHTRYKPITTHTVKLGFPMADEIIEALTAAGYRLLGPDEAKALEALLVEAGHICEPFSRCPVAEVHRTDVPGPPSPPVYCILPAGHEGAHRSNFNGPLIGPTEERHHPDRCKKCREPWPCSTVSAALAPTSALREDER